MMSTELIYSQFKESIKSAVHTTKISSIAKTGRFSADYLFGIESSEDKLYSSVIRDMEETALREVDKLLENLCKAYGYHSYMPCQSKRYFKVAVTVPACNSTEHCNVLSCERCSLCGFRF